MTLASLFSSLEVFENGPLVCPVSNRKGFDHAKSLSMAFWKLFEVSRVLPVRLNNGEPQKYKKTRGERLGLVNSKVKEAGNWVFVDDVFVTGATCYKISETMGSKPKVVLTLLYKEKEW